MKIFITDCEGPISKNDNAMEIAAHFLPQGEKVFTLLSKYDDYLAYVEKRTGYKAGDTLRLILPFLKAFGATDKEIEEYSRANILLMPGAVETLRFVREQMPAFIISTSYKPYIKALCEVINFPYEDAYCTELILDRYPLPAEEKGYVQKASGKIARMPMIEWGEGATGYKDLSPEGREVVQQLNQLFWDDLARMQIGRVLKDVNPIGGEGKASVVRSILQNTGAEISEVMYVGDSITDLQALELVKGGGGLAVSFNGNVYAIQGAQVACVGGDTGIISIVTQLFTEGGLEGVIARLVQWGEQQLRSAGIDEGLLAHIQGSEAGEITADNQYHWTEKSQEFRTHVRGVNIGSLG